MDEDEIVEWRKRSKRLEKIFSMELLGFGNGYAYRMHRDPEVILASGFPASDVLNLPRRFVTQLDEILSSQEKDKENIRDLEDVLNQIHELTGASI